MRALRPRGRAPKDHALDQQRAPRRPPHLQESRLPPRAQGAPPQLRPRARRGDLGPHAVTLRPRPAAASAATGILVGAAMVATRYVVDQTGPASLALLRYAIGFCFLLPVVLLSGEPLRLARRDLLTIALLAIT